MDFKRKFNSRILLILFLIAVGLRFLLASQGGQFFIVDELRYRTGNQLLSHFSDLNIKGAIIYFLSNTAHTLFQVFATISELIRFCILHLFDNKLNGYELNLTNKGIYISSFFISLFSAFNIVILHSVIKSFGGTSAQGLIASLLLFLSTINLYFSRHLVPYDISITFSLISFYYAGSNKSSLRNPFLCGLFSGISVLTYFGYWPLAICSFILCVLKNKRFALTSSLSCMIGGMLPVFLLQILGIFVNINFLKGLLIFINATKQNQMGDLFSGTSTLIEYLWHAEHIYIIVLLFIFLISFFLLKKRDIFQFNHKSIGLYSFVLVLLILLFFSEICGTMVLYGRTIKQLIPLLCLACSYPIFIFLKINKFKSKRLFLYSSLLFIIILKAFNFTLVFNITFPNKFKTEATIITNSFEEYSSLTGEKVQKLENRDSLKKYSLINAQWLIPPIALDKSFSIKGDVIIKAEHPYKFFPPYLFLHYNSMERTIIKNQNLDMLLIKK